MTLMSLRQCDHRALGKWGKINWDNIGNSSE